MTLGLGACVAVVVSAGGAAGTDLAVRAAPGRTPASLAMRAEDPEAPAAPAATTPAAPSSKPGGSLLDRYAALPADLEELSDRVIFHFQLGQELTQGQGATDLPDLTMDPPAQGDPRLGRNTRFFTIGGFAVGSRGLLVRPLSSYLAGQFRFDQSGGVPAVTSLPTAYDPAEQGGGVLVRSAYAEVGGLGGFLRPLRLRAGRQYRYGLGVAHFDGLTAGWETSRASLTVFFGQRTSLYRDDLLLLNDPDESLPETGHAVISGAQGEVRIVRVGEAPILVGGELFNYDGRDASQASVRFQATREIGVTAFVRGVESSLARSGVSLSARLSRTATVTVDLEHRRKDDFIYDFVVNRPLSQRTKYLRFDYDELVTPELFLSARGGTVLFDNLDVLFSAAAGVPTDDFGNEWAAPWYELGAAVDGRLRNNTSVALGGRVRTYDRAVPPSGMTTITVFDMRPYLGESTVADGSLRLRYALGRKRFAAEFSLFVRYESATVFNDEMNGDPIKDEGEADAGTRFYVEAWLGPRARLLAEYQVTSSPERFKELRGLQALRLLGEVSF